jgi:hypothetical protein
MTEDQTQQNQQDLIIIIVSTIIVITIITLIIIFWPKKTTPSYTPPPSQTPSTSSIPTSQPPQLVTVYTDADYQGQSASFLPGLYFADQTNIPNDSISSVKVPPGKKIELFEHAEERGPFGFKGGRSIVLTSNISNLESIGFNDTASAWRVS